MILNPILLVREGPVTFIQRMFGESVAPLELKLVIHSDQASPAHREFLAYENDAKHQQKQAEQSTDDYYEDYNRWDKWLRVRVQGFLLSVNHFKLVTNWDRNYVWDVKEGKKAERDVLHHNYFGCFIC